MSFFAAKKKENIPRYSRSKQQRYTQCNFVTETLFLFFRFSNNKFRYWKINIFFFFNQSLFCFGMYFSLVNYDAISYWNFVKFVLCKTLELLRSTKIHKIVKLTFRYFELDVKPKYILKNKSFVSILTRRLCNRQWNSQRPYADSLNHSDCHFMLSSLHLLVFFDCFFLLRVGLFQRSTFLIDVRMRTDTPLAISKRFDDWSCVARMNARKFHLFKFNLSEYVINIFSFAFSTFVICLFLFVVANSNWNVIFIYKFIVSWVFF